MKLQFESKQEYQLEAIQSDIDIFEGQPLHTGEYEFSLQQTDTSFAFTENRVSQTRCSQTEFGNKINS